MSLAAPALVTVPASDIAHDHAPARVVRPRATRPVAFLTATTLRLGHGARWVDSDGIDAGVL